MFIELFAGSGSICFYKPLSSWSTCHFTYLYLIVTVASICPFELADSAALNERLRTPLLQSRSHGLWERQSDSFLHSGQLHFGFAILSCVVKADNHCWTEFNTTIL